MPRIEQYISKTQYMNFVKKEEAVREKIKALLEKELGK